MSQLKNSSSFENSSNFSPLSGSTLNSSGSRTDKNGLFVGLYVIEFDNVSGEKVAYKQVSHPLNVSIEKELIGMLMGADYYEYSSATILLHTITNYHVISIHFTCFNPSNKRGFVTTCCIAIIQSSQFTSTQIDLLTEHITRLSTKFQNICLKHKDMKREYNEILSLHELIDECDDEPLYFQRIMTSISHTLLSTHTHYTLRSDFINVEHAANIIGCGGHSLFNWSFAVPQSIVNEISNKQENNSLDNSPSGDAIQPVSTTTNELSTSVEQINKRNTSELYTNQPIVTPFPPCTFPDILHDTSNFNYTNFVNDYNQCFPNILYSLLSGLQLIVYSSTEYDVSKLIDIAKFLWTICISGTSSEALPTIQIVDNQQELLSMNRNSQLYVICQSTTQIDNTLGTFCYLDVTKGFYGLKYPADMNNSILESFVKYAREKKPLLAQKMWNVMLDYSQLTMKCFINPELNSHVMNTSERLIVMNFQRKIEQEKTFVESGQTVIRRFAISQNMFCYIPLQ
ncbi:UDENN domain-containing protein [Entamoeba marina]